ncbi:MAG: serine hydrolase [Cytophagaceae bacterium]|nr:serine hydrolase [Gemmatimonadaceae bacterium]
MNWTAYHDLTSAEHQARFVSLYTLGWRMITLSVYGARGNEQYAAVWVERGGPGWSAVHGIDAAGYQLAFNNAAASGLRPVLLSVTGPANDPVFAGTFEQTSLPIPLTRFGLVRGAVTDPATIDHWTDQARQNGWYPTSLSIYGNAADQRYAGIWEVNGEGVCWTTEGLQDTAVGYQARFDALAPTSVRPAHVAVSADGGLFASIFRDDQLDGWVAIHNRNSAGYQQEFNTLTTQGLMPVMVQAGGAGSGARFAAVFARSDAREALSWRTPTGPVTVTAIDDAMRLKMQRHRIRGASLALVQDGRLVYARGYTFAEANYPTVQPTTFFRQASVSKTIVALAAHRLIQDGRLALNTTVQGILGLTRPDGSAAPASFNQVTVQHLLEHTSGLPTNPYSVEPSVASAFGVALPVDGAMTDRYMLTLPANAPPAMAAYNNWGYFLLGHVVQAVTGTTSLVAALDALLFRQLGITRIRQARTRIEDQPADEVRYHGTTLDIGPSVVEPDRRLRGTGYGGWWNLERDDAGGGLTGATVDVARLLAMLDVRTGNPVFTPAAIGNLFTLGAAGGGHGFDFAAVHDAAAGRYYGMKGGSIPESNQNCVRYMTGDISMVLCWNRHGIGEGSAGDSWWYADFPAVLNEARAHAWGAGDLFPAFGMPSFGARQGCLSLLTAGWRVPAGNRDPDMRRGPGSG